MERSESVYGNKHKASTVRKAEKTKQRNINKYGDDSNANYSAQVVENPYIGDILGVKNIAIGQASPGTSSGFDTDKGIIVGNIRMGFGHYRISMAMASAAHSMGLVPYWMDLNSYPETTGTKVISAQNDLYSMGSRISQKNAIFNKLVWEPVNYTGFKQLSYNAPDQKNAELMAPVFKNVPKDIPVIGTHVWPCQAAIHAGMKYVVNTIPDNWPMALHFAEGAVHTIQCHYAYLGYRTMSGMAGNKVLKPMPSDSLLYTGHYIDDEFVRNIEKDNERRIARKDKKKPMRFLLTIGGAGAQKEIFAAIIKELMPDVKAGRAAFYINIGDYKNVWDDLRKASSDMDLYAKTHFNDWEETKKFCEDAIDGDVEGIHIFCHENIYEAVYATNLLMRSCDVLVTKPSELAFYPVPKLFIKRIGGHEQWNAVHSAEMGDGSLECRDIPHTLQMARLFLDDDVTLRNMCDAIDLNKRFGLYGGAYNAVKIAMGIKGGDLMRLTAKEKIAYGLGAVGKDMVYMLSASYVLYYFQDILGVSAIAMGIILMIARVFDAFNDPIMGVIVAKTKTRWGKFRPWLMIGTITNAVILIVMFSAPPALNGGGLIAYAAVTYILWGITYTMMDIPYWSMIPAFTESGKEREGLTTLARSAAGVGSAVVTILTVMSVAALGNAFSAKESDLLTKNFSSDDGLNYTAFVLEVDGDQNPTGNVTEFNGDNAHVSTTITGARRVFGDWNDVIYVNSSNADVTLRINDEEIEASNVEFVMGDYEGEGDEQVFVQTDPAVAFYVDSETYAELSSETSINAGIMMESNLEVERVGFKYFSMVVGILFVVFITITCLFIKEKSSVDIKTASVGQMFKALIQNDQAMTIVITIVLVNSATYITSNLLIYFFKYDLAGTNWQGNYTLFNTFAGGIQIIAMMIFFPILRKFFNTLKIFYICIGSAIGGYIILLAMALAGLKSVFPFFVPGFFIMAAVGILNVVVTIFLANTVDYGHLKNNRRDESVIFSMQTFVVKLASGISALVASICLAVFNIKENSDVVMTYTTFLEKIDEIRNGVVETISSNSVIGLRMVMTLTPIIVLVVAVLIFKSRYILTDKKLGEIITELKAREA